MTVKELEYVLAGVQDGSVPVAVSIESPSGYTLFDITGISTGKEGQIYITIQGE